MPTITGLHHVTAIAGDAQENLDFYTRVMGMRLVKRSVNQDAPDTYHLFYGDGVGHAGSDLTFFPWPAMPAGKRGTGLTNEVSLAVPAGSLDYWSARFAEHGVASTDREMRFGERALPFSDPHGLALTLTETSDHREFTPWEASPVPAEHQVRGLHSVRMAERDLEPTTRFLTEGLGFVLAAEEGSWKRYAIGSGGSGRVLDVQEVPGGQRGSWGAGAIHHIAWRVPGDETELMVRERVERAGVNPTPVIDRFWFKSVYFKEPGGALFEVATDGPGFAVDESAESLGSNLILPPWLEPNRAGIENALPKLVALVLALLIAACSGRSGDAPKSDSAETHVTLSNPAPTAERTPLAVGDIRIVTADSGIDLALIGDTISSGLSEHAIAKVRQETDTAKVTGTGFGADIEKMVKGTVQKAVGTRVAFPISSVRTVHYDGRAIVFEWAGKPPKIFGSAKVNDKPLLETFPPEDAKRFADAVMARKRARGM